MFLHGCFGLQTVARRCCEQHTIIASFKFCTTTFVLFAVYVLPELMCTEDSRGVDVLDDL